MSEYGPGDEPPIADVEGVAGPDANDELETDPHDSRPPPTRKQSIRKVLVRVLVMAVGIGLAAEAELAAHLGLCGTDVAERIRRLVQAAGLPDRVPPKTSFNALWGAMQHDKKVVGGNVIGVWPVRIGDVVIRPLPQEACAAWFRTLGSHERRRPERRKS